MDDSDKIKMLVDCYAYGALWKNLSISLLKNLNHQTRSRLLVTKHLNHQVCSMNIAPLGSLPLITHGPFCVSTTPRLVVCFLQDFHGFTPYSNNVLLHSLAMPPLYSTSFSTLWSLGSYLLRSRKLYGSWFVHFLCGLGSFCLAPTQFSSVI
ncbi:PREDICTED: uncharacterized protein LOC105135408 [Populus euphratica]|uniref:Uncharacterized protein LOC105135408 n=1 Tax=Populus euphratica TaxID=75702 RepID=A0AAJ6UZX4_POPEU|nr:PREDICTED: uncharacterized protein LOC105135408 [Populus euphratica]